VHEPPLPFICLDRVVDLPLVRLHVRDWPGFRGPLVHVPDPLAPSSLIAEIAQALAPRWRVVSPTLRSAAAYQTDADAVAALLRVFGFDDTVLFAEGHGCAAALLVAAWQLAPLAGLLLVAPIRAAPAGLAGRGLGDCPPEWDKLLASVTCPLEVLDEASLGALERFLLRTAS